jgi:hypothetical protein
MTAKYRRFVYMGDSDADFSALLKRDGVPDNVAARSYSQTFQDYYKLFRSYGIGPTMAWDMMETIDRDQGAKKSLDAGVSPDLVVQAWEYQLFKRGSPTSTAIVNGAPPLQAITAGLQAIGITPAATGKTGISQTGPSAYIKNLPPGMNPGDPYTVANTSGGSTTYQPDWFAPPGAAPTPVQQATAQAQITDPAYWKFPSGDVGGPTITAVPAGTPSPTTTLAAPIDLPKTLAVNPWLLAAGAAGLFLLAKAK